MIDELAYAAGIDPSTFRLQNSGDERWSRVLTTRPPRRAKWQPHVAGSNLGTRPIRKGRGVAIGGFASSFVAIVADIEVDKKTGKIRVKHLYAANDCGLVINPSLVEQQMEGAVIQGVSRALHRGGQVLQASA